MMPRRYTRTAMAPHCVIAGPILADVAPALSADHLPGTRPAVDLHQPLGITVLGLATLRVPWRASHPAPPPPTSHPVWERWSARAVRAILYLPTFGLPLSGWAHDPARSAAASHPVTLCRVIPWPRLGWFAAIDPSRR